MLNTHESVSSSALPEIIQGGMGVGVSNWRLAKAVARQGQLGVVSGTAIDTILIRRLQDGDKDGSMRRGIAAFPYPAMAEAIVDKWYIPCGKAADAPYRLKPMPTVDMLREDEELLIVANFVEVFLAKEGHGGLVGINLLEKIQLPTLPSLFGAMLAGVDVVIMGGGIPLGIPRALDRMAQLQPVDLRLNVESANRDDIFYSSFHPGTHVSPAQEPLKRPLFFAVIASDILAKTLLRKASGRVDGFVVEHHNAGGHNAPPRRGGEYSDRDICSLEKVAGLGRPFWLAGACASPARLAEAKASGAVGVQVGTAFACCEESGISASIKAEVIGQYRSGKLEVITDFNASPTGYPFKRVEVQANRRREACRTCDLGYLRHLVAKADGSIIYRCPSSPRKPFLNKGGDAAEAEGKLCLCNGLLATIGMGQIRRGRHVQPLVTWGEDMSFLDPLLAMNRESYSAAELITYLQKPVESA